MCRDTGVSVEVVSTGPPSMDKASNLHRTLVAHYSSYGLPSPGSSTLG